MNSTSDEESETQYNTRFSMSTVGDHTKRSQNQNSRSSHRHYVRSWVEEQRQKMIPEMNENLDELTLPAIIVTDADQEESTPTDDTASHKSPQPSVFRGTRRASLYPSMINEPIIEVQNEDDAEIREDFGDTSRAKDFHDKSMIQTNDRKRAKSYPSGGPSDQHPTPLLELPKQPQPIEESETNVKTFSSGIRKFAHVAVMAKKWKKRSSQDDNSLDEQKKESVASRQRKRQYVEIPRALKLEVYEEAIPLAQKMYQMYKSCLGPKHKLTLLTEQHLQYLATQLEKKNSLTAQ